MLQTFSIPQQTEHSVFGVDWNKKLKCNSPLFPFTIFFLISYIQQKSNANSYLYTENAKKSLMSVFKQNNLSLEVRIL